MFCDYELSNYRGDFTAEDNNHGKWSIKSAKSTPQEITLEDEIHMLRRKMEQIFWKSSPLPRRSLSKSAVCWI